PRMMRPHFEHAEITSTSRAAAAKRRNIANLPEVLRFRATSDDRHATCDTRKALLIRRPPGMASSSGPFNSGRRTMKRLLLGIAAVVGLVAFAGSSAEAGSKHGHFHHGGHHGGHFHGGGIHHGGFYGG